MIELDRYWENPRWLARAGCRREHTRFPFRQVMSGNWMYCKGRAAIAIEVSAGDGDSGYIPIGEPFLATSSPQVEAQALGLWLWFLLAYRVLALTLQCLFASIPHIYLGTPRVAAYVRDFELPKSWAEDREIHFVLEGVRSCCFLWVNGSLVGYSQGSGLPSEFVITPWLGPAKIESPWRVRMV